MCFFFFFFFKQKTAYEISACLVGSEMCIRDRRHREDQSRDPQAHALGRDAPQRKGRAHAGGGPPEVRRGERVGLEALPGRDAAGRGAAPGGGLIGLSESAQEES